MWRRREGVEPSGNLTTPRLVLKTSGTTGHLPSPQVISTIYVRSRIGGTILSTIYVAIFNRSRTESRCNVFVLQVNVAFVHLHTGMAACAHGNINVDTAP